MARRHRPGARRSHERPQVGLVERDVPQLKVALDQGEEAVVGRWSGVMDQAPGCGGICSPLSRAASAFCAQRGQTYMPAIASGLALGATSRQVRALPDRLPHPVRPRRLRRTRRTRRLADLLQALCLAERARAERIPCLTPVRRRTIARACASGPSPAQPGAEAGEGAGASRAGPFLAPPRPLTPPAPARGWACWRRRPWGKAAGWTWVGRFGGLCLPLSPGFIASPAGIGRWPF
jgi:hypothetical protein